MSKNALFATYLSIISQIEPFILFICRSSYLYKILPLFDKDISLCPIFDFINQNNQYEQAKNPTRKSERTLPSRKHQTYLRIYHCMRGIFNYCNPSKHLTMTPIQTFIYTLETQLKTMPDGYVRETVEACLNLAKGIKEMYENTYNNVGEPTDQD